MVTFRARGRNTVGWGYGYRETMVRRQRNHGGLSANSGRDDLVSDRVMHQFRDRVRSELVHNIGAMRFDCHHANSQDGCHFLVALAFGDQSQYFQLPWRETGFRRRLLSIMTPVSVRTKGNLGDARCEKRFLPT